MALEHKITNICLSIEAINAKIARLTHRREELEAQKATLQFRKEAAEVEKSQRIQSSTLTPEDVSQEDPSPTSRKKVPPEEPGNENALSDSHSVSKPMGSEGSSSVVARAYLDTLMKPGITRQEAKQCLVLLSAFKKIDVSPETEAWLRQHVGFIIDIASNEGIKLYWLKAYLF